LVPLLIYINCVSSEMLARSILITGCSRGLGLELTKQLVPHAEVLIATCRDPVNATVTFLIYQ
jgi:short-subunit dehydrogenase involved in D-alanine esterification of teichoic acids